MEKQPAGQVLRVPAPRGPGQGRAANTARSAQLSSAQLSSESYATTWQPWQAGTSPPTLGLPAPRPEQHRYRHLTTHRYRQNKDEILESLPNTIKN